jgi:hypothetical protein
MGINDLEAFGGELERDLLVLQLKYHPDRQLLRNRDYTYITLIDVDASRLKGYNTKSQHRT